MAAMWFVMQDGKRMGPYPADQLQDMVDRRQVDADDLVWCEGMADWVKARTVMKPSDYRAPAPRARRPRYEDDYERDDYRDMPALRKSAGPPGQFPGRLITPGFFFICMLLFFCPWVDVRCGVNTVASQSGLQLTYGGYSESYVVDHERRNGKAVPTNEQIPISPFAIGFGVLVLAGFIFGLALHTGLARILLTALPAFAAFVLLMIQVAVGFSAQTNVERLNRGRPADFNVFGPVPGMPPPFFHPGANQLYLRTTVWFWLAVAFCLFAIGGLLIEHSAIFGWGSPRDELEREEAG